MFGQSQNLSRGLRQVDPVTMTRLKDAMTWPEAGQIAGDSQFKIARHPGCSASSTASPDPCRGAGNIGKDDAIQQAMLDFGHNVTCLCTTGIDIGPLRLVFFTGAADVDEKLAGSFLFTLNTKTREIVHNKAGRKIVCVNREIEESDLPDADAEDE